MIGSRLTHFEVAARLGEGGMGEVYLAQDTRLGREVAIKVLPDAFVADPDRLARVEREARVLASLSHPNVAGAREVLRPLDGRLFDHHMSFHLAESYAAAADRDWAMTLLEHAIGHGFPRFAPLEQDARRRWAAFVP